MFDWARKIGGAPYRWFESMVSPGEDLGLSKLYRLFVLAVILVLAAFLIDLYLTKNADANSAWHGIFGDFFGGVVNPILTFLTFFGLLITIVLQKEELSETRKELARSASALDAQVAQFKRQSAIATFYKMLDTHMAVVASIDLIDMNKHRTVGRDCMRVFRSRLKKCFKDGVRYGEQHNVVDTRPLATDLVAVKICFVDFWRENGEELQHYIAGVRLTLSFLYQALEGQDELVEMYKALFTDSEKALIFYYAVSMGDADFCANLEKSAFCVGMPRSHLLLGFHESGLATVMIPAYGS
ncbi:hypothetical protein [Pseudomonas sp. Q1-7]|uniref:hypothetical protein n=1 Tax=Pseudomonas sp. Q1-7 TaxID=3020843 RepID=UPI002300D3A3|nr:hypothetical protein [Pseudomonas sp. Q1-7]